MVNAGEINLLWSSALIEELVRLQVCCFAIAPGSRSSPITVAVALNKKAPSVVHIDERGLGFFALGCAKGSGKPAVIITTSGTAVANLFPAIVEASQSHIPLIVLSADRPLELYATSANQTIDQVKIFGSYVRWFMDMPSPSSELSLAMVLSTMDQAYAMATQSVHPGPVHINCHFPEPLLPSQDDIGKQGYGPELQEWTHGKLPYTRISAAYSAHGAWDYKNVEQLLADAQQGLVILGEITDQHDRDMVLQWIKQKNWPVFADMTSQLKSETMSSNIIEAYDLMLLSPERIIEFNPDTILHIGSRIHSKRLTQWLKTRAIKTYIKVQNTMSREDESFHVTHRLTGIQSFCEQVTGPLKSPKNPSNELHRLSKQINKTMEEDVSFSELTLARALSEFNVGNQGLFIGNSMPIRNMQMVSHFPAKAPWIYTNRGASGIDGLIATACGCAYGSGQPITLVIGDISALHDLNSLILVARSQVPITVILVNNDGGALFSYLPIATWDAHIFDPFFVTPHGYQFPSISKAFGIDYVAPQTLSDFKKEYEKAQKSGKSTLIECIIDRQANISSTQAFQKKIV